MNAAPVDQTGALTAARRGDRDAFSTLAEPYRHELMTYCYRMLGSIEDAEDEVQETYLKAWKRLETYEGRASFRAWMYKIATNACLDALEHRPKRILILDPANPDVTPNQLSQTKKAPVWIEPFPDDLLAPASSNPEARYDAYESISLTFLVALQVLPPRQRTVLILRDILDYSMAEIADTLGSSLSTITSLIHRARINLEQHRSIWKQDRLKMHIPNEQTRQLLDRYARAWESADIDQIVSLLTEDAVFPMPPLPVFLQGKRAIRAFFEGEIFSGDALNRWKLLPIRANGCEGFAFYQIDAGKQAYHPFALQVLSIDNNRISATPTFGFPQLFRYFNLPPTLPVSTNGN